LVSWILSAVATGAVSLACTSILGVEDLHQGPNPNAGGQNAQGGSGTSGTGGTGDHTGGQAGNSNGGNAGTGGTPGGAVNGTVMDFFGHKLPNVVVTIGTATVSTDTDGKFTIPSVAGTYDASLVVNTLVSGQSATYGWVYQGLTRRDPTLQVYRGVPDQSGYLHVTITNGTYGGPPYTTLAFGSPDGSYPVKVYYDPGPTGESDYVYWYGPGSTQGGIHALNWNTDANSIPTSYLRYTELPVSVDNSGNETPVAITYPSTTVPTGVISGTVTSPTSNSRDNYAHLRFTDNAALPLLDDYPAANSFSYTVPDLANSTITIAATEGGYLGPFAVAHKDVAAGQTNVALSIPAPPTLVSPTDAATAVNASTTFRWTARPGVVLFSVLDNNAYDGVFIVTTSNSATLPLFDGASLLRGGAEHSWYVETDLDVATVDAAAGPEGFLDAYAWEYTAPQGSRRGDGTFSYSVVRTLTTAP
jgi:hypothetical protein